MAVIKNIHDFMESSGVDSAVKAITNALYGFNHTKHKPLLESNKDFSGYTFFTRPQLNLTDDNIRNVRTLYKFLNNNPLSAHRFVRLTLDPRLHYDNTLEASDGLYNQQSLDSPIVDKYNPFIPILSNTLETLSGWPDIVVPTFTSSSGLRKEQWSMVDGIYEIYDVFDLNATFTNFNSEPLTLLFELWNRYPSLVYEGMMERYVDFIIENEFDYNTRIYRFITDESGRFIKKVATTGASFPNSEPSGKFFDYSDKLSYSDQTKTINIKFKCMGAIYNDDISLLEFNKVGAIFNPLVRKYLEVGDDDPTIEVIPYELLPAFNYRGYPVVDLDTYELKWIVSTESKSYKKIFEILKNEG